MGSVVQAVRATVHTLQISEVCNEQLLAIFNSLECHLLGTPSETLVHFQTVENLV